MGTVLGKNPKSQLRKIIMNKQTNKKVEKHSYRTFSGSRPEKNSVYE